MGLTGIPFLVLVLALTLAALLWGALRAPGRKGVRGVLGRLGVQVLTSALVVLSVATVLNRQNEWYVSWGDLFGSSPTPVVKADAGGVAPQVALRQSPPGPRCPRRCPRSTSSPRCPRPASACRRSPSPAPPAGSPARSW